MNYDTISDFNKQYNGYNYTTSALVTSLNNFYRLIPQPSISETAFEPFDPSVVASTSSSTSNSIDIIDQLLNNPTGETIIDQEIINNNKLISKGLTFQTYEEFKNQLKLYCRETYQDLRWLYVKKVKRILLNSKCLNAIGIKKKKQAKVINQHKNIMVVAVQLIFA